MASIKGKVLGPDDPLSLAGVEIAADDIIKMIVGDGNGLIPGTAAAKGVVMLNERINDAVVVLPDGRRVLLTGSIYLQRQPLDDAETAACAKVDTDRTANAAKRKTDEANERQRALNAASEMSRTATLEALKSVGAIGHINRA